MWAKIVLQRVCLCVSFKTGRRHIHQLKIWCVNLKNNLIYNSLQLKNKGVPLAVTKKNLKYFSIKYNGLFIIKKKHILQMGAMTTG